MDHHDLKASEIESNCGQPLSPDKQTILVKENNLPVANAGIQKQGYGYDRDTYSCKAEKLSGVERNDRFSYSGCTKGSKTDKQCKTESSSSNTPHIILPASSNDSCQETSLEIQSCKLSRIHATDSSTCTDLKSSLKEPAIGSLQPGMTMHNPDDKLENKLSPAKGCNMVKVSETLDSVRTRNSDNLSGMRSSDNLSGMSSDNNYVAMERANILKSDLFKKETKVSVHGKAKLLHKLEDVVDVAPAVAKEVDQDFEASGSSSSVDGRNSERFRRSFVDSVRSNRKSCLTETGSESQQSKGDDKSFSFCSRKEVVGTLPSARNESLCLEVKEPVMGTCPKVTREVSESPQARDLPYQTMKAVGLSPSDLTGDLPKIDLNEDVLDYNMEYLGLSGKETVPNDLVGSVSKPKPVMAKRGTPLGFLAPEVQKEGKLGGWRGSTATSAFQPTSIARNGIENKALPINDEKDSEKHSAIKGIDLNLDAAGADFDVYPQHKFTPAESSLPSSAEASSTKARKLDFDLNCVGENDDNCHQASAITSLSRQSIRDFDLNDNPVPVETSSVACQPGQVTEALRKAGPDGPAVSYVESSKQHDYRNFRPTYSADLHSLPGFISGHVQPFLVAPPNIVPSSEHLQRVSFLQPQLAFTPSLPAFRVDPKDSLYSAVGTHGMVPYVVDPHAAAVVPQVLGSGAVPAFPSHVFQVPRGSSPSNIAITRPNVDAYNGVNALENVGRGANSGQLCVPLSNSTLEEQMKSFQQVGVSAAGTKRHEPEGGWDLPQLSFRQMTSWR